MKYYYTCVKNESLENTEWETGKFEWTNDGYLIADDFESFVHMFQQKFKNYLNEINMWETDSEVSENGTIWASNSVDGLDLVFEVICKKH